MKWPSLIAKYLGFSAGIISSILRMPITYIFQVIFACMEPKFIPLFIIYEILMLGTIYSFSAYGEATGNYVTNFVFLLVVALANFHVVFLTCLINIFILIIVLGIVFYPFAIMTLFWKNMNDNQYQIY